MADVDARHLQALRIEGHDGERRLLIPFRMSGFEPDDRGTDVDRLDDVVAAALLGGALPLAHPHLHARDDDALGADALDVGVQLLPRVVAGVVDQLGPAGDLGVARGPAGLPDGLPVAWSYSAATVMPRTSEAGIQPLCTSLAKSWPDRSEVNGLRSGGASSTRAPRCRSP